MHKVKKKVKMCSLNLKKCSLRELLDIKESLEVLDERNNFELELNCTDILEKKLLNDKKKLIISSLNEIFDEIETRLLK